MATLSARKHYRDRIRKSMCRGRTQGKCFRFKSCRMTKGSEKRKKYCRKKRNTRRM